MKVENYQRTKIKDEVANALLATEVGCSAINFSILIGPKCLYVPVLYMSEYFLFEKLQDD